MPFSYPFCTLFVPLSCLFRVRIAFLWRSLLFDLAHLMPPPSGRLSSSSSRGPSTIPPPRCAAGNWRRNGFGGNAVFESEKREKFLDFLPGAQRGRCARARRSRGRLRAHARVMQTTQGLGTTPGSREGKFEPRGTVRFLVTREPSRAASFM